MTTTAVLEVAEKKYSVEEYFELEKNSEVRHEFYYGKLIEMTGSSKKANSITLNLLLTWRKKLIVNGFDIYSHNIMTKVKQQRVYTYPNIVVTSQTDDNEYIVEEPVIIIEMDSPTYKVSKLKEYTAIPSLKYYLIVSQEEMSVQLYYRKSGEWLFTFFEKATDVIVLPDFSLEITLAEIYDDINLVVN